MLRRTTPSRRRALTFIKTVQPGIGDDALPAQHALRYADRLQHADHCTCAAAET
jgi:hypothetical protein